MKKRITMFLCVSLFIIMIFGCGSPKEPGRYYNKAHGFSIRFPEGWKKTRNIFGGVLTVIDPEGRVKLGVLHKKIPQGMPLDDLVKGMRSAVQQQGFKIIMEVKRDIDGVDAHWFRILEAKTIISYYIVRKDEDSYAIMASYDKDSTDQKIELIIKSSVDSFKFIE